MNTAFVYSDQYSKYSYPEGHPFDLSRADRVYEIMKKHNLLDTYWISVVEPARVTERQLLRAHDERYIELLKMAGEGEVTAEMLEHGLGTEDCPIIKGLYDLHVLAAGATFRALSMVAGMDSTYREDYRFAFNPMGGFHHAGRSQAGGFCYINDVSVAIYDILRLGKRVAYIDLDAHHGDGVQDAFYNDDRVLVISMHESGKYLYPGTGFETETGEGPGKGYTVNVPLEKGTDDEVYFYAFNEVVPPLILAFQPDIVIAEMGGDVLSNDPVASLHMTNNVMADAASIIDHISPKWVCLGAGGYNVENTARAWALVWAVVNGAETRDDDMGTLGGVFLGDPGIGIQGLKDMHSYTSGPEKEHAYREVDRVINYLKDEVFPVVGAY